MNDERSILDALTLSARLENYRRSRSACPGASRFVFDELIGQTQAMLDALPKEERRSRPLVGRGDDAGT